MALGIAPEPLAGVDQRGQQRRALDLRCRFARRLPAGVDAARVIEQRVVEIDE
jgi:hypothetical protein